MRWFHLVTCVLSVVVVALLLAGTASTQPAEQRDLDTMAFDRLVQAFRNTIQGAAVALFDDAEYGLQVRGATSLVPVSANPTTDADVDVQLGQTDLVLGQLALADTRLNLLILDACRTNPFAGRGLCAAAGGLTHMQASEGTRIASATQPSKAAQDGPDDQSPSTQALASAFRTPGLDWCAVSNETRLAVTQRRGGAQQPWVLSAPLAGPCAFAGTPDPRPPTAPAADPQGVPPAVASPQPPSPPLHAAHTEARGKAGAQDKHKGTPSSPGKSPPKQVLFEDTFDRDELGDLYEVLDPDPSRLALHDGKLLLVATEPSTNHVVLQKTFSGDFVATVPMTMQVTQGNGAGVSYSVDEKNALWLGVYGETPQWIAGSYIAPTFRGLHFGKTAGGQSHVMQQDTLQLGTRQLTGESPEPELWYLQLERKGVNYTARMSADAVAWTTIGTHVLRPKGGRLGFFARAGAHGRENTAAFGPLVIQGAE
jgi:hypothetical protein